MKKLLLILFFFSCPILLFAQINLDIKNKKINFFKALESQYKSKLIKDKSSYFKGENVYQPIIYKRKQANLPDLLVYYYAFKDSTISYILYEWQDTSKSIMVLSELKEYFFKYNDIVSQISTRFGKSVTEGNLRDTNLIANDYLRRSDRWKNDTTDIEAYVVLSNRHPVFRNIRVMPTHTIRLYVGVPSKERSLPVYSRDKVKQLDEQVKSFLTDICAGNFDSTRMHIAAKIAARVNDEQLDKLKEEIKDDMWDLQRIEKPFAASGKLYTTLRYVRRGDTTNPPAETLNILFDDEDKIVTVQPLKGKGR